MTMPTLQQRRGTTAALQTVNPTPLAGEIVWASDTNTLRVGDGVTAYSSLSVIGAAPTDGSVTTAKVANDAVTYAKLQNVSATDRLLGRSSAGAGDVEEITCTAFGRSLIDDADAASARSTLSVQPTASPKFTGAVQTDVSNDLLDSRGNLRVFTTDTAAIDKGGSIGLGGKNGTSGDFDPWAFGVIKGAKENGTSGNLAGYLAFGTAGSGGTIVERLRINSSGQLLVTTGSASACGVAFSGDPDTGIAQLSAAGANTLSICTNSAEAVRVNASQNVGIGVSPTHRLDCNGEFRLRGAGASTEAGKLHLYWVSSTNRATWTTDASGNALIETGSSAPAERFRVGVNGRSQFFAASEKYGVQLNNGSTANGPFIGSDGADIFTISTSGGAERVRVKATGAVRFVPLSADPSTGNEAGDVYYNSSTNKLRVYNGTSWVDLH